MCSALLGQPFPVLVHGITSQSCRENRDAWAGVCCGLWLNLCPVSSSSLKSSPLVLMVLNNQLLQRNHRCLTPLHVLHKEIERDFVFSPKRLQMELSSACNQAFPPCTSLHVGPLAVIQATISPGQRKNNFLEGIKTDRKGQNNERL